MRIRSTKPEFWRSERIASVNWEVVYDGPIPRRTSEVAPESPRWEYVYMLFDAADELVYVGRSFRPADRFTKHRRKPWWPLVTTAALVRVHELPPFERLPWQKVGPNTARFEAVAIDILRPPMNVAAPARGAMR